MGGENDGAGAGDAVDGWEGPGAEVGEELDHVVGGCDVEVGKGFVEEQEFGVGLETRAREARWRIPWEY